MRLVYLSSAIIPSRSANSIHVMKMCQAFARVGHDVLLLAPDHPAQEPGVSDPWNFYGVERCFQIKKLPWLRTRGAGHLYAVEATLSAWRSGTDVLYGRFVPGCFFTTVIGLPVIYESHFPVGNHGRLCDWMFRRALGSGCLKRLVVVSEALARFYRERYNVPDRVILVAHDAADESKETCSFHGKNGDRLRVGYVGHLYPGRGIELIAELARRCEWADFYLVGGTIEDTDLWRKRLEGIENIRLCGFVPPCDTDRYRQVCDVLLAPYERRVAVQGGGDTSEWMSPLKIFEYMAAGKAIICSDLPVIREVLEHERTALLCESDDLHSWIAALERLRDDTAYRRRLGEAAKEEFLKCYTWTARAKKVLEGL